MSPGAPSSNCTTREPPWPPRRTHKSRGTRRSSTRTTASPRLNTNYSTPCPDGATSARCARDPPKRCESRWRGANIGPAEATTRFPNPTKHPPTASTSQAIPLDETPDASPSNSEQAPAAKGVARPSQQLASQGDWLQKQKGPALEDSGSDDDDDEDEDEEFKVVYAGVKPDPQTRGLAAIATATPPAATDDDLIEHLLERQMRRSAENQLKVDSGTEIAERLGWPHGVAAAREEFNNWRMTAAGVERLPRAPTFAGAELDLYKVLVEVMCQGGYELVTNEKRWKTIAQLACPGKDLTTQTAAAFALRTNYQKFLLDLETWLWKNADTLGPRPDAFTPAGDADVKIRELAAPRAAAAGRPTPVVEDIAPTQLAPEDATDDDGRDGPTGGAAGAAGGVGGGGGRLLAAANAFEVAKGPAGGAKWGVGRTRRRHSWRRTRASYAAGSGSRG